MRNNERTVVGNLPESWTQAEFNELLTVAYRDYGQVVAGEHTITLESVGDGYEFVLYGDAA